MIKKKVGIVGGGLSGLSAAVYLLKDHPDLFEVSIFESAPWLGGQAASWKDEDGDPVETGIHLDFPWYENKPQLYKDIGSPLELRETDGNYYVCDGKSGGIDVIYSGLSAWKTLYGLATFPNLTIRDRWKLARFVWSVMRMTDEEIEKHDGQSAQQFLEASGCSKNLIRQLSLATVTIQGLYARDASAASFLKFLKTLYGCAGKFNTSFFSKPIGDSLIAPLEDFIRSRGGKVYCGTPVSSVAVDVAENRGFGIYAHGESWRGDYLIFAVPAYTVPRLLPNFYSEHQPFRDLRKLESAKIITLQLWYRQQVFPDGNVFIANREGVIFDTVADKARHWDWPRERGSLIQVLIDTASDIANLSDEEIYGWTLVDLQRFFPKSALQPPYKWNILRHKNVYSETKPGYWSLVPRNHETPIKNLFLAGDYTDGPYHYGMESAVISGKAVANLILGQNNLPTNSIIPVSLLPFVKK